MSVFSQRLQEALEMRGSSQKWLADSAQTTEATISRYVNGGTEPAILEIIKNIAIALDVSSDFLIGITSSPIKIADLSPEEKVLLSVWQRITDSDKNVVFALFDKYLTEKERKTLQEAKK